MIPNLPPRLTPAEQADVARRMCEARDKRAAGDDSAETEAAFIEARNALAVDTQSRFCTKLGRKYAGPSITPEDAAQEAFLGGLLGTGLYEPGRGCKPVTIGCAWSLVGAQRYAEREIRQRRKMRAIDRVAELADRDAQLETPQAVVDRLGGILGKVSSQHATILRLRFGIDQSDGPLSWQEIGDRLGLDARAAYQAYRQALQCARMGLRQSERRTNRTADPGKSYRFRPERCPVLREALRKVAS